MRGGCHIQDSQHQLHQMTKCKKNHFVSRTSHFLQLKRDLVPFHCLWKFPLDVNQHLFSPQFRMPFQLNFALTKVCCCYRSISCHYTVDLRQFHKPNAPVPLAGDATALVRRTKKNNRYAARSPRWFGGTSSALLFRMCCVSTAYRWRMGDAHATHMAYEWRFHCVWCRVWELDHCVFTAQVAYARRTSHVRAAVNAIRWRMAGVCTFRMGCVHAKLINTPHYMRGVSVTFKWPCSLIHMYLNVQFHLSNLIWHVYHRNDIVLITGRIIC